ncbi:MAG: hypothetical protein QM765_28660 [Myxococcales bacterium]
MEAEALAASRKELNDVVRALHERREPGMSVFEALAELETRKGTRLTLVGRKVKSAQVREASLGRWSIQVVEF